MEDEIRQLCAKSIKVSHLDIFVKYLMVQKQEKASPSTHIFLIIETNITSFAILKSYRDKVCTILYKNKISCFMILSNSTLVNI